MAAVWLPPLHQPNQPRLSREKSSLVLHFYVFLQRRQKKNQLLLQISTMLYNILHASFETAFELLGNHSSKLSQTKSNWT